MLFMELSVGQYTGRGPIGALGQICPLFKGMARSKHFSFDSIFLDSPYANSICNYQYQCRSMEQSMIGVVQLIIKIDIYNDNIYAKSSVYSSA